MNGAAIGELSVFHDHFGYYARGARPGTAHLPSGWRERLVRLQTTGTNQCISRCLEPADLVVSKACAAREEDADFNRAPLRHGIVRLDDALQRVRPLEGAADARRAEAWIHRLAASV